MERVLTGQSAILTHDLRDADGTQVVPDDGVTVTVTDLIAGDLVHEDEAASQLDDGLWRVTLDPPTVLGPWQVDWSYDVGEQSLSETTFAEVVGGHLFTIHELRTFEAEFADEIDTPAARIRGERVVAEDRVETAANVAFVPRRRKVTVPAGPRPLLLLPDMEIREVESVTIDGVVASGWELDSGRGALTLTAGWTPGTAVTVVYSHGLDQPPGPIRRAAMLVATELLVPSSLPARATSQATDVGTFRLSLAGRDGLTGIPEVDAVCAAYGRQRPAVG